MISAKAALKDRNGMMDAYYDNLGRGDFIERLELLAGFCMRGTALIPQDGEKAYYWRRKIKEYLNRRENS